MSNKIGVYLLQIPSGKCYVGMTCDSFENRWRGHLKELKNGRHKTTGLRHAYTKYGWNVIKKIVLEEWEKPSSQQDLQTLEKLILKRERYWWEQLTIDGVKMLHGCPTGTGSVLHNEATKEALRKAAQNKALKNPNNYISEDEAEKIIHLYEVKGLSGKEIARALEKSYPVVRLFIKDHSLKRTSNNPNKIYENLLMNTPLLIWYFDEGKSAVEIAASLGYSNSHISSAIRYAKEKDSSLDDTLAKSLHVAKVSKALKTKKKCKVCNRDFGITVVRTHEKKCKALELG